MTRMTAVVAFGIATAGCLMERKAALDEPAHETVPRCDQDSAVERALAEPPPSEPEACATALEATSGGEDAASDDREAARALFEEGSRAYEEGRHDDAASAFCTAYARMPATPLLWNIARSLDLMRVPHRAADYYEAFADRSEAGEPAGAMVGEARERARELRAP